MSLTNVRPALLAGLLLLSLACGSADGFFFEKLERLKRLPGLSSLFPSSPTNGVRVCINFNSNYPQGYQQNTCFICDAYRFNQIATYCTGQSTIPVNINYTQANCIMNQCQPANSGPGSGRPMLGGGGVGGGGGGVGAGGNIVGGSGTSSSGVSLNALNYPFANNNYIN